MLSNVYLFLLFAYIIIHIWRYCLTLLYWSQHAQQRKLSSNEERLFTVVQPILSGDPCLRSYLRKNLLQSSRISFIWLIDNDDGAAMNITASLLAERKEWKRRVKVLRIKKAPQGVNPKVFKLTYAVPFCKKYMIILDDDSVVHFAELGSVHDALQQKHCLITGIPYYNSYQNLFSSLVSGFVNGNSLFTYLPNALLAKPHTINGMFYMLETEFIKKYDIFNSIQHELCDDYEISKFVTSKNIEIVQSTVPCEVNTSIQGLTHYMHLSKRWMVFANQFLRENFSFLSIVVLILPSFLPAVLLLYGLFLWYGYVALFLFFFFLKSCISMYLRKRLLHFSESKLSPLYEMLADFILPIHYISAVLSPKHIVWRSKKISLHKGLHYSK